MKLSRAQIINFRSIKDVTITFDPRCRVLVGINESGKSNILAALALLDPSRNTSMEDVREQAPDEPPLQKPRVRFVFALDKEERNQASSLPISKIVAADDPEVPVLIRKGKAITLREAIEACTEAVYHVSVRTNARSVSGLSLWGNDVVAPGWHSPSDEKLTIQVSTKDGDIPLKEIRLIHQDARGFGSIPENALRPAVPNDVAIAVSKALEPLVRSKLPDCIYWSYSDDKLLPPQLQLEQFAQDPAICEPLEQMFYLAGVSDIRAAIKDALSKKHGMRNLLNRVAAGATKHMRAVWKDYKGVSESYRESRRAS